MVIWPKVRRNEPQSSTFLAECSTRSTPPWLMPLQKPMTLEKDRQSMQLLFQRKRSDCPEMRKRVEITSNFHLNAFWLNVRPKGPQPRICGRSFSQSTSTPEDKPPTAPTSQHSHQRDGFRVNALSRRHGGHVGAAVQIPLCRTSSA